MTASDERVAEIETQTAAAIYAAINVLLDDHLPEGDRAGGAVIAGALHGLIAFMANRNMPLADARAALIGGFDDLAPIIRKRAGALKR